MGAPGSAQGSVRRGGTRRRRARFTVVAAVALTLAALAAPSGAGAAPAAAGQPRLTATPVKRTFAASSSRTSAGSSTRVVTNR